MNFIRLFPRCSSLRHESTYNFVSEQRKNELLEKKKETLQVITQHLTLFFFSENEKKKHIENKLNGFFFYFYVFVSDDSVSVFCWAFAVNINVNNLRKYNLFCRKNYVIHKKKKKRRRENEKQKCCCYMNYY